MAEVTGIAGTGAAAGGAAAGGLAAGIGGALVSGGISLAISLIIGSILSSKQRKKINRKILDQRSTTITQLNSAGSPKGMVFGRSMVPGYPVYATSNDDLPTAINAPATNEQKFGHLAPRAGESRGGGPRSQYLLAQYVFSLGKVNKVENIIADGGLFKTPLPSSGFRSLMGHALGEYRRDGTASPIATDFTGGAGTARFTDGSDPGTLPRHASVNGTGTMQRDVNSRFTGLSYLTCVFKRELDVKDDPKFGPDTPVIQVFTSQGNKTPWVNSSNLLQTGDDETYSNNAVRVLMKYLLNDEFGPHPAEEIDEEDFALETWRTAIDRADIVFRGPGALSDAEEDLEGLPDYSGVMDEASGNMYLSRLPPAERARVRRTAAGFNFRGNGAAFLGYLNTTLQTSPLDSIARTTDFSQTALLKHEFNGRIMSDESWQDILDTLVLSTLPGSIVYHRGGDRKLAIYVPDGTRPAADQAVMTITDKEMLSDPEEVPPDSADIINQLTVRYTDIKAGYVENTVTWPPVGSPLYEQWVNIEDGGAKLHDEVSPAGIDNEAAAIAYANTVIRISRRPHINIEVPKWGEMIDPGHILQIQSDRAGMDTYIAVELTSLISDEGGISIGVSGIEFNHTDYQKLIALDGTFNPNALPDFILVDPTALDCLASGGEFTVIITDPNYNYVDSGYEIEIKSTEVDAEWEPFAVVNSTETKIIKRVVPAGTYTLQVRKFDIFDRKGDWVETTSSCGSTGGGAAGADALSALQTIKPEWIQSSTGTWIPASTTNNIIVEWLLATTVVARYTQQVTRTGNNLALTGSPTLFTAPGQVGSITVGATNEGVGQASAVVTFKGLSITAYADLSFAGAPGTPGNSPAGVNSDQVSFHSNDGGVTYLPSNSQTLTVVFMMGTTELGTVSVVATIAGGTRQVSQGTISVPTGFTLETTRNVDGLRVWTATHTASGATATLTALVNVSGYLNRGSWQLGERYEAGEVVSADINLPGGQLIGNLDFSLLFRAVTGHIATTLTRPASPNGVPGVWVLFF